MKGNLRDHLVFCDMDNTLLTAKEGVPQCNRTVIQLFTRLGGRFTVATGRPPESIRAALGDIELSAPAISCNGSLLYDLAAGSVLRRTTLDQAQGVLAIRDVMEHFPKVGVEVMAGAGEMYVLRANATTHAHQVDEKIGSVACPLGSVPDGWLKIVFADTPDQLAKLSRYVKNRYYGKENYFLSTNSIYLEIMPGGASKASAMRDLCTLLGVPLKNTIVIGDYYNDLEMMKAAGYAVAVANAPGAVKAEANEITVCDCAGGAVGEFLYKLLKLAGA